MFEELRANFDDYDDAHRARSLFAGLDQRLEEVARERAKTAPLEELIFTVSTWQVKSWRMQLLYFNSHFQFDVYHGRKGSLTVPVDVACLKLSKSGKWTAEVMRESGYPHEPVPLHLEGLKRSDLTTIAGHCSTGMIVDGVPVPREARPTQQMRGFIDWAATNVPRLTFTQQS